MGVLLRRRCLKRRATARARLAASNNLYPVVARYATDADTVQVRLEDTCALESQHLVPEPLTTNIPPITTNHLDTKVRYVLLFTVDYARILCHYIQSTLL